jgi:hypothetical protein
MKAMAQRKYLSQAGMLPSFPLEASAAAVAALMPLSGSLGLVEVAISMGEGASLTVLDPSVINCDVGVPSVVAAAGATVTCFFLLHLRQRHVQQRQKLREIQINIIMNDMRARKAKTEPAIAEGKTSV